MRVDVPRRDNLKIELCAILHRASNTARFVQIGRSIVFAVIIAALAATLQGAERIYGVCSVVHSRASGTITVRGLGIAGQDGFILLDHTCPVASSADKSVPASILLSVPESPSGLRELINTRSRDLHQVVATGEISCIKKFELERDRLSGNGFDKYGLVPCKLVVNKVLALHRWW